MTKYEYQMPLMQKISYDCMVTIMLNSLFIDNFNIYKNIFAYH